MFLDTVVIVLLISEGHGRDDIHVQVLSVGSVGLVGSVSDLDAFSYTTLKEESIDTP